MQSFTVIPHKSRIGASVQGINITEENRATEYVRTKSDLAIIQNILRNNYLFKGVKGVIAGIPYQHTSNGKQYERYEYAIFLEDGWLEELPDDE